MAARIETVSRVDEALGRAVDDLIQDVTAADGVPPVGEHKYLKLHHGAESVRAILAWDDDRLVGYAQVLLNGEEATVEVVVRPNARRRGLGGRLLGVVGTLARC